SGGADFENRSGVIRTAAQGDAVEVPIRTGCQAAIRKLSERIIELKRSKDVDRRGLQFRSAENNPETEHEQQAIRTGPQGRRKRHRQSTPPGGAFNHRGTPVLAPEENCIAATSAIFSLISATVSMLITTENGCVSPES